MERTPREVTWSSGSNIASDTVAKAFKLEQKKELLKRSDAGPTSGRGGIGCGTIIMLFVIILVLLLVIKACVDDQRGTGSNFSPGGAARSGGGSFGGFSSGGGHK
jgi:hypothetical protein